MGARLKALLDRRPEGGIFPDDLAAHRNEDPHRKVLDLATYPTIPHVAGNEPVAAIAKPTRSQRLDHRQAAIDVAVIQHDVREQMGVREAVERGIANQPAGVDAKAQGDKPRLLFVGQQICVAGVGGLETMVVKLLSSR